LSRLAQNGSGMHAAMLMTAQARGWPLGTYLDSGHPLQQSIAAAVEDLTGESIAQVTVDRCGAPLFSVSLRGLTRAVARIASAAPGTMEASVADAIREYPEMASGSWRDVARLMRAVPGLLAKDGFEGVQVAALPDGRAVGVKIADGADRARMPVAAAALALCGVDRGALAEFANRPLLSGMTMIGSLRAAGALTLDLPAVPPASEA
jgi:L-asparaginase II